MKCEEVQKQLSGDIELADSPSLREHILKCDDCGKFCAELRSLRDLSRLLGDSTKAPPEFSCQVRERLLRDSTWRLFWSPLLFAGLAMAVLAGLLWMTAVESHSPSPVSLPQSAGEIEPQPLRRLEGEVWWVDPAPLAFLEDQVQPNSDAAVSDGVRFPSTIEVRRTRLHDDAYLNYTSY